MPARKQKKRPTKKRVNENYEIAMEDYSFDYHFGINYLKRDFVPENFWEGTDLRICGQILSPKLKTATKAVINLSASPKLNDHYLQDERDMTGAAIGSATLLRDKITIEFLCILPERSFPFIISALASGKARFASIYAQALKYGRGDVYRVGLKTKEEEDDEKEL